MAWLYGDSFDAYQTAELPAAYDTVSPGVTIDTAHGQCGSQSLKVIQTPESGVCHQGDQLDGAQWHRGDVGLHRLGSVSALCVFLGPDSDLRDERRRGWLDYRLLQPRCGLPACLVCAVLGAWCRSRGSPMSSWDILFGESGTGEVSISIDGLERYSQTGLTTAWPGEAQPPTGFQVGGTMQGTKTIYFDSLYLMDRAGPAPWNAQLGHVGALTLLATGAGASTDFAVTGVGSQLHRELGEHARMRPNTSRAAR